MNRKPYRPQQMVEYIAKGLTLKQIAVELGIGEECVKYWMGKTYATLDVKTRTHGALVAAGFRRGLLK